MKFIILPIIIWFLIIFNTYSQQFTEQTSISLTGVYRSSVDWGDYDNDGDLDILLIGLSASGGASKIYKNNGDDTFTEQTSIPLTGVTYGSVKWGDYDNDGYLDILLTGNGVAKIYKNNGDGTFTEQTSISLTGVGSSSVAWGDYNNDGYLDILLTGYDNSVTSGISKIYKNDGDGTFTEQTSISLAGVYYSSVAWGDYDNDGDLDILLTGWNKSKVYKNNGDETFTEQTSISLTDVYYSSTAWGDYNNDGYIDILLTGSTSSGQRVSRVYKNNGDGTFSWQTSISLIGVQFGSVCWGDYNNDGNLDILLTGYDDSDTGVSKIYKNNGDGTFTEQTSISLTGVGSGSVAWGDYDNDGDLDILLTGDGESSNYISKIYKNNNVELNTTPTTPTNLTSTINDRIVTLNWDRSTDNETPQDGLHYNLVIGTSPNAVNTLSPMADRTTGYRRVVRLGNSQTNSWTIKDLPLGTYYWGVQAIDGAFEGSKFASEKNFTIIDQFTEQTSISLAGIVGSAVWGDYNNDDYLDILLAGGNSSEGVFKIYKNNGNGTFSDQTSISLISINYSRISSAAWGDYNNDGYLDILVIGNGVSKVYKNNGDGTFTDQTSISLTGLDSSFVAWGDYNNDGYLDILLAGVDYSTYDGGNIYPHILKIYKNNRDGTFTEQTFFSNISSATWGDYDNDGDIDILATGYFKLILSYIPMTYVYKNNGDGTFTGQTYFRGARSGSIAWGDYDNDGNLDILSTGRDIDGELVSNIYKNNGDSTFTEQTSISLAGIYNSSVAWGDYNNDGNLDILLAGYDDSFIEVSKIYKNNGDETFTEQTSISLTGIRNGSVAWGDYDNDGDLDILLAGYDGSEFVSKIYTNNNIKTNTTPTAPANLSSTINGNDVIFTWDKSTDNETPQNGLHYNLVIGTSPNAVNTLSPLSDRTTGYRRVVRLGNSQTNSWTIKDLLEGKYYWSVQAIDNTFSGSNFATEQMIERVLPVELISFTANVNHKQVLLNWKTETEVNNYGFEIQRKKSESNDWEKLGFVAGNGNSNTPRSYRYIDKNITGGSKFEYRLKQIDNNGQYKYSDSIEVSITPRSFELFQNYPNPFNPTTYIQFTVPKTTELKINVYTILGEKVLTVAEGKYEPGIYKVKMDASGLPSGIYIYRIESDVFTSTKKMVLMK